MPIDSRASAAEPLLAERKRRMELLARADESALGRFFDTLDDIPEVAAVRGPETGLVMIRGRMGGGGAPFNLGEATVSRATVRLATGEVGFGQTLGLSLSKARLAAVIDALAQSARFAEAVSALLDDLVRATDEADEQHRRRTAATKVDFFTMVRGED